jgi:hypothetical protein
MLGEPGAIAAVLEKAGLEPEKVPAALAMAGRFRDALGHDAARGEALAAVVNRIELPAALAMAGRFRDALGHDAIGLHQVMRQKRGGDIATMCLARW